MRSQQSLVLNEVKDIISSLSDSYKKILSTKEFGELAITQRTIHSENIVLKCDDLLKIIQEIKLSIIFSQENIEKIHSKEKTS
eukprot:maker-scaffold_20-snap-gene-5.2-mRNA-1 protein AED:0.03 eAED:0.03 QI:102/1/1/1/1/1/3/113/82